MLWSLGRSASAWAGLLGAIVLACIVLLETRFQGLETEDIWVADTPVTLTRAVGSGPLPPVIVAHGFGGSRQMMDQIAVSLARQGFLVASVDLPGHGRNSTGLSPDITTLDGTTSQLVSVVSEVASHIGDRVDTAGPISFVGHSMATDIVIRASQARDDAGAVVAISMYSPAVTPDEPAALLVLSGATEGHLRNAGLAAVQQIDPSAEEGETVTRDGVTRRTAVAPLVGHVGVLYSGVSLAEMTQWLRQVTEAGTPAPLDRTGWIAGVLFVALTLLVWPLARFVPKAPEVPSEPVPRTTFLLCLLVPVAPLLLIALLPTFGIAGHASFGTLSALLAAWGLTQLAVLGRHGLRPQRPEVLGMAVYLAAALLFALALDRYGAAFLPTGPRLPILLGLLVGTLPLMLADTWLVHGAGILGRILARLALLAALTAAMALSPTELGLTFTVLPVLILFFLVYGTMARWIAVRRGPGSVAWSKGIVLAWAIAASTPLFAVTGLS